MLRRIAIIVLFFFCFACATVNVKSLDELGMNYKRDRDEQMLWDRSVKEEMKLNNSDFIYKDIMLESYLGEVVHKLNPLKGKNSDVYFTVKVIKNPALNAFAYPNGVIYVHTGLLSRLENESQLAFVLGHEMTHVIHRDALRMMRHAWNERLVFTILGIGSSIGLTVAASDRASKGHYRSAAVLYQLGQVLLGLGLQLGFSLAVNGYSRDLEAHADENGLKLMMRAGYNPQGSLQAIRMMLNNYGDSSAIENFFFGSHPNLSWRLENLRDILKKSSYKIPVKGFKVDSAEFQKRTRVVVREDAWLNIQIARYGIARHELERVLKIQPNDYKAYYYQGKLYSRPSKFKDLNHAISDFKKAIDLKPDFALSYRDLGIVLYENGNKKEAKKYFAKYLKLSPKAKDKDEINEYMLEL